MGYIDDSLSKNEEVTYLIKLHWLSYFWCFVLVVIAPPTLGVTLPFAIWEWLRLRTIEQGVTNKRVIMKRGIISRTTEEMKISSIETVEILQGIIGRMLGFGTIRVTGRGISDVVFKNVDDPMLVKKEIESLDGASVS